MVTELVSASKLHRALWWPIFHPCNCFMHRKEDCLPSSWGLKGLFSWGGEKAHVLGVFIEYA